ncbi:MAG: enoyl-CoA hydratase/isomerase family protein [Pseudomonadota bacterium]
MSEASRIAVGEYVAIDFDGPVAKVTFDRGDQLNALSAQAMKELLVAAQTLSSEIKCHCVVLTGGSSFSAGADLKDPKLTDRSSLSLLEQREAVKLGPDMCQAWADLEQITICAIERFCVGGGLALAASCDHRVMAADAHARLPEVPLGMNMSWRSVPRIVSLVGPAKAKELIILGRRVEADEALAWGLVDRVEEPGGALDEAMQLAEAYSSLPPVAVRMAKQAIDTSANPLGFATSFMDRDQFLLTRLANDEHTNDA